MSSSPLYPNSVMLSTLYTSHCQKYFMLILLISQLIALVTGQSWLDADKKKFQNILNFPKE